MQGWKQSVGVLALGALLIFTVRIPHGLSGGGLSGSKDIDEHLQPYLKVLRERGQEPMRFVLEKLASHDLIIFDDAVHSALEPFEFYQQLVRDESFQRKAPAIFLEVVSINRQRHLDAYLNAPSDNPQLLYPAFQDELNGKGWDYQSYFDLLRTVRTVNKTLRGKGKLKVYGVNSPTLWSEIQTRQDLDQFHKSLTSREHHMYAAILNELAEFKANRKGIFLTNTRHAYKGLRRRDGPFFWNTATFFQQWNPGKAYSIRLHNVSIQAVKVRATASAGTAEGRETIEYRIVRMARGLWDSAFRAAGNRPVAFPLQGNAFGEEPYTGAEELDAMPGQKMQDVYDAAIFLAPLEKLRESGTVDIYTPAFKQELKRRLGIMWTEAQLAAVFKKTGTKNLDECFVFLEKNLAAARSARPLSQVQEVGPIDEWKTRVKE